MDHHNRLLLLATKIRQHQSRDALRNGFIVVFLVFLFLLSISLFTVIHYSTTLLDQPYGVVIAVLFFPFWLLADLIFRFFVFFWPFLLFFFAGVWMIQQRTLLSLIQVAAETQTSLGAILRAYTGQYRKNRFTRRVDRVATVLENGHSLEESFQWEPSLVRYDVLGMIRIASDSPESIRFLNEHAEEEQEASSIRTMALFRMAYFCSIILPMMLVIAFMMHAIFPKFEAIFKDFDYPLPTITAWMMMLCQWTIQYFFLLFPIFILFFVLMFVLLGAQSGCLQSRPLLLRRYFRDEDSARLLRLLALGVKCHKSVPTICEIYQDVVQSRWLRKKAQALLTSVKQGHNWVQALTRIGFLHQAEADLLESAQRTGNIDSVLNQLASGKTQAQLRKNDLVSKLIFIPTTMLLGLLVALFFISLFFPLVSLIEHLSAII